MPKVLLTVLVSRCRCGYLRQGDAFTVEDICPPLCQELWNAAYPYVFALRNGALLDCGAEKAARFIVKCPDEGRVVLRGEAVE
ncbi:MAG: TIGR04076 family protein [Clostridia bacterium]|nr:TIGR04076 family protein [Clostridia bacterium]